MVTNLDCLISVLKCMYDHVAESKPEIKPFKHDVCKKIYDILWDFSTNNVKGKIMLSSFHERASYSEVRDMCNDLKEKMEDGTIAALVKSKKIRSFIKSYKSLDIDDDTFKALVKKGYKKKVEG